MDGLEPIRQLIAAALGALQSHPDYEAATLVLAGVFAWSGLAKLRRPRLAAMAIADFGLVDRPRRWQGMALGLFELGLGAAIAIGQGMTVVLGLACLTLLALTALLLRALGRSESFACFCFGGEEKLSRATLVRNLALLALAGLLWSASLGTAERLGSWEEFWLTAIVAAGALASSALIARVPRLLRWNWEVRDHFEARARECGP